jgi:hypothetical protein
MLETKERDGMTGPSRESALVVVILEVMLLLLVARHKGGKARRGQARGGQG